MQAISISLPSGLAKSQIGIAINTTNTPVGMVGTYVLSTSTANFATIEATITAKTTLAPGIGINNFVMIEQAPNQGTVNIYQGTSANMALTVQWRG